MKKYLSVLALNLFLLLGSTSLTHAHSGAVNSMNCHICTFECEMFDLEYNKQHCHKGEPITSESIDSNHGKILNSLGGHTWDKFTSFIVQFIN